MEKELAEKWAQKIIKEVVDLLSQKQYDKIGAKDNQRSCGFALSKAV